ncbi:ISKra4 family transposase [Nonomuraea sp. FMUSA5-5]|uniref:ISKra4 family transposase n=1 Tax=Nonomuraea composti TaxID=2720023 RepID=A0ABX1B508_9ACTN|nr:ISKra4 family transposase [Nonomuraea sp. FMUSA5-5]NJP91625.1 ISKra4 family transposase [Nonomuraea sp. FMUSA5-5]
MPSPEPLRDSDRDAVRLACSRPAQRLSRGRGVVAARGPAAARAKRTFRTRLAAGQKSCRKRMATLGALYDAEPAPRRPHDVIALPGGRAGERRPRPGPHANGKWLCGSVINDPDEVIAALFDQAEARDPRHARVWVVLVDGAHHQLDLIRAEAARRSAAITITIVIDVIHVIEKLWAGAWCLHRPADPGAEDWVATHALVLLAGHTRQVITDLDSQATHLPADRREGIDTCMRYLSEHAEFLRYDQALAAGWPIATGVIEGACRHLIADRLDITGARWGLAGAEAILKLRALVTNNDLSEYWRHHLGQEHQRVHGPRDAGTPEGVARAWRTSILMIKGDLRSSVRRTGGSSIRVITRILPLTTVIWHNDKTGQPTARSRTAYDH